MDKPVDMLDGGDQITKARHLIDQLDLKGEAFFQCAPKAGVFAFVAMRPDERTFVNVNLETKVAKVTHIEGNFDAHFQCSFRCVLHVILLELR